MYAIPGEDGVHLHPVPSRSLPDTEPIFFRQSECLLFPSRRCAVAGCNEYARLVEQADGNGHCRHGEHIGCGGDDRCYYEYDDNGVFAETGSSNSMPSMMHIVIKVLMYDGSVIMLGISLLT